MKKIYPRLKEEVIREDLYRIMNTFTQIARGEKTDEEIGYMSMGEYEKAMEYFELGKDQAGYGEAKAALRDEKVRKNFALVAAVVVIALIGILGYEKIIDIAANVFWSIKKRRGDK